MIDWKLKEEGFDKEKISYLGNKFLTGNGYMGVRGTLAEYGKENLAAINLAGIYDKVGDGWREPLNAPNGFYTYLVVDGEVLKLPDVNPEVHYTELDYRNGIFTRHSEWDTARGKITFDIERFVSMSDVHLGVMKFKVIADFHADVEVVYGIDGDVWDINGPHYDKLEYIENDVIGIIGTTHEKGYKVAVCGGDKTSFPCEKKINVHDKKVLKSINFVTDINKEYVIERFFGVYTSKDCENCVEEASKEVTVALRNGYEDAILTTGEIFGFWVIEGPKSLEKEFPAKAAGLPVLVTDNHKPYKQRKVRILNGAHTSFVLGAYLAGQDIVRDCMEDEVICSFMNQTIYDEIIPTLDLSKEELEDFASAVTERFKNPFIDHALLAISLNSTSKWRARVMPSLKEYVTRRGSLPACITASFAFYIAFYNGQELTADGLNSSRKNGTYTVKDDADVLEFFYSHKDDSAKDLVHAVCTNISFWGEDLSTIDGFEHAVTTCLEEIRTKGTYEVMKEIIKK